MRKSRIILNLIFALFLGLSAGQAAHADRDGEVCTSVNHCLVILENHAADSFDYDVLRHEFLRFGDDGKDSLMLMVSSGDRVLETRALQILFKGPFRFSPADQRELISIWPSEDRTGHARVLKKIISPLVRSAAIDTLSHPDPEVRTLSRTLLADASLIDFPMRGQDYALLARAALDGPTPGLVKLLGKFPPEKTAPILARVLRSGQRHSVIAAYEQLYAANKETAMKTLVGVIADLKDDELPAALAISDMLQRRHRNRNDGFYLQFAKDLAKDSKLSQAGRAVGYDAWLRTQVTPKLIKNPPHDSPVNRESFRYVVETADIDIYSYVLYLQTLSQEKADVYISALNQSAKRIEVNSLLKRQIHYSKFIAQIGRFRAPLSQSIVKDALRNGVDFNIISAATFSAAEQNQSSLLSDIQNIAQNHPLTRTRISARSALDIYKLPDSIVRKNAIEDAKTHVTRLTFEQNQKENYCSFKGMNFKQKAQSMPFFDSVPIGDRQKTTRFGLRSAAELKSGWLAGYNFGEWGGGLIYFDYDTGASKPLIDDNILAIIPTQKRQLGYFPTSFWVVTGLAHMGMSRGGIYNVTKTPTGFTIDLHATLPGPAKKISINADNSVALDFVDYEHIKRNAHIDIKKEQYNPPLLLEPNGAIRRLCENNAPAITDATP